VLSYWRKQKMQGKEEKRNVSEEKHTTFRNKESGIALA
jgi:hypothetical protein